MICDQWFANLCGEMKHILRTLFLCLCTWTCATCQDEWTCIDFMAPDVCGAFTDSDCMDISKAWQCPKTCKFCEYINHGCDAGFCDDIGNVLSFAKHSLTVFLYYVNNGCGDYSAECHMNGTCSDLTMAFQCAESCGFCNLQSNFFYIMSNLEFFRC